MKDSVELCQRFGRARQEDSLRVVMDERKDRPVTKLQQVKQRQNEIIGAFDPCHKQPDNDAKLSAAQKNREKNAETVLEDTVGSLKAPVAVINLYVVKTKAHLKNKVSQNGEEFHHEMTYKSILKSVAATGTGKSKKQAKAACALKVIEQLRNYST